MIKIGNTGIVGVYKGSTPITSIYKGIDLVFGGSTPPLDSDIVFEYDTALGGNNTVYLPIVALHQPGNLTGQASFIVDWGDGQTDDTYVSTSRTTLVSHTYNTAGTYEVRVTMDEGVQEFSISNNPVAGTFPNYGLYGLTKIKSYGNQPTSVYFTGDMYLPNLSYVAPDYYGILTNSNPNTYEKRNIFVVTGASTLEMGPFPKLTGRAPYIEARNVTTLGSLFGHNDQLTNWTNSVRYCSNLVSIDELYCAGATSMNAILLSCRKVHTIKSMYWGQLTNSLNVFDTDNVIRHLTIKNIGYNLVEELDANQYNFSKLQYWGVNNEDCPNARQSLIDSLLTYSKDLGSDFGISIQLSQTTYNLLTPTEIQQIEAKGYRLSAS